MVKFAAGAIVGILFGSVGTAWAVRVIDDDGYLVGWTVTVDGDEVCESPFVWTSLMEIECD